MNTTNNTQEESPFARETIFWEKVMQETKKRWPNDELFKEASVRELIECAFVVHENLLTLKEAEAKRDFAVKIETLLDEVRHEPDWYIALNALKEALK